MDYLLQVKISALFGLLVLTLLFGFIPARLKWFRDTNGTGLYGTLWISAMFCAPIALLLLYELVLIILFYNKVHPRRCKWTVVQCRLCPPSRSRVHTPPPSARYLLLVPYQQCFRQEASISWSLLHFPRVWQTVYENKVNNKQIIKINWKRRGKKSSKWEWLSRDPWVRDQAGQENAWMGGWMERLSEYTLHIVLLLFIVPTPQ